MPRFAFGKRKSTAEGENNDAAVPSFRVLDRSELVEGNGKSFDGGVRLSVKNQVLPRTTMSDVPYEDNIFADFKPNTNRGSGSSNTTKTNSTDNSSRHSNASTTPSSTDLNGQDDWRMTNKRSLTDAPGQSTSRQSFLKSGRSWSFGGSKKQLPPMPVEDEDTPATPAVPEQYKSGRARATTSSTDATVTPPQIEQDTALDLGSSSFSSMFSGFNKRASAMSMREDNERQILQPTSATGGRFNAPSPLKIDRTSNVEPPQHSWTSNRSNDNLLEANENVPPPVPKHGGLSQARPQAPAQSASDGLVKRTSAIFSGRRKSINVLDSSEDDELDSAFLAVSRYMSDTNSRSTTPIEAIGGPTRTYTDTPGTSYKIVHSKPPGPKIAVEEEEDDDNIFDNVPLNSSRSNPLPEQSVNHSEAPSQKKVMTPSEFEKYRKEKEFESRRAEVEKAREQIVDDDEDDNYEDDEDEAEKSRQLAKQRRKQEAHMSVYRQQMMKVTGESSEIPSTRPGITLSMSSPNLTVPPASKNASSSTSENEDDDEEVPLAILAAHGFPNKNRPPTRLNNMMSNPNLRQASQPSYQRPSSAAGQTQIPNGPLPPFARGLPQDPYGLVNSTVRESFALGGGVPAGQNPPMPPGGLVGVIASEERAKALRRGTPQVAPIDSFQNPPAMGHGGFDPMQGIPPHMMYPQGMQMPNMQMPNMMLSPGEQVQMQLSQQMTQFMEMQMQFMQMMANNGASQNSHGLEPPRSAGHTPSQSLSSLPAMNGMGMGMSGAGVGMDANPGARGSFLDPMMGSMRGDVQGRTMSMVQPSSASWIHQRQPSPGYAGSIRGSGNGYAPSIAPSERSNIGLPGRYRPVSHIPAASVTTDKNRNSATSPGLSPLGGMQNTKADGKSPSKESFGNHDADDDEEEGWAAMKAKRDQKKSSWRLKKTLAPDNMDLGSLIT